MTQEYISRQVVAFYLPTYIRIPTYHYIASNYFQHKSMLLLPTMILIQNIIQKFPKYNTILQCFWVWFEHPKLIHKIVLKKENKIWVLITTETIYLLFVALWQIWFSFQNRSSISIFFFEIFIFWSIVAFALFMLRSNMSYQLCLPTILPTFSLLQQIYEIKKCLLSLSTTKKGCRKGLHDILFCSFLKVRNIQNEFMRSSFLPKSQPKITKISALEVY